MVTPNQFELELLSERKINNENDALEAMKIVLHMGPKVYNVV